MRLRPNEDLGNGCVVHDDIRQEVTNQENLLTMLFISDKIHVDYVEQQNSNMTSHGRM